MKVRASTTAKAKRESATGTTRSTTRGASARASSTRSRSSAAPSAPARELESVSTPKQARSERTLEQILAAAERLIVERGLRDVSIADVVREAGTSVGGFYGRFRDKDELLRALHERTQRDLRTELLVLVDPERWKTARLEEIVRVCVDVLVRRSSERRRLMAAFLESVAASPDSWQTAIAFRRRLVDGVSALLLTKRAEMKHPDPPRAVRFAIDAALAIVDERAIFHAVPEADRLESRELAQELERLVLAYLGCR
ncbi:MAG: TetR/AcrR family transcriptional regulator [Myxococcota bacterium]|jgi:AcrR family transcriptional regulator|nr:TetR/AcrR family transcriptional regulator [Myxococcota bacterium]